MRYLLGIDLGTSGTKTVLFDVHGAKIASETVEYPLYQPKNGWAEQVPEDWWNAACCGVKSVIKQAGISNTQIAGVGISGQMHGLVMLDREDHVIRKSIIWCDQRTGKECDQITQKIGQKRLIEVTANPALTGFTASKILWVRNNEPENYEKCCKIMLPKDYIKYRLTGEFSTEVSDASGMQLLDITSRKWSDEVLEKLEIDRNMLGEMYESCEVTGKVCEKGAAETGLAKGTIVVGGAGDNFAAAIGTGTVSSGKAFTTLGTSGVVFAHADQVTIDLQGRVHTFCSAVPGKWCVMSCTQAAGLSLRWLRDTVCREEVQKAETLGKDPYEIMSELAENVPIGSDRLLYLPYLMGERSPHLDPDARGVFFGLSAMHNKANLIRAVMEGVAFSQLDCVEVFRDMGVAIDFMAACGGGGRSALWRKMLADLYGCSVYTLRNDEGPSMGAAVLAGVGAGEYDGVEQACKVLISYDDVQKNSEQNSKAYEKYHAVYKAVYHHLKADFKNLANL